MDFWRINSSTIDKIGRFLRRARATQSLRVWGSLFFFILLWQVIPFLFLRHYQQTFAYNSKIIAFGSDLLLILMSTCLIALLLLTRIFPPKADKIGSPLFSVTFTILTLGIAFIYAASYFSNRAWGDTLNYEIVGSFAQEVLVLAEILPFKKSDATILVWISGALVIVVAISFYLFYLLLSHPFIVTMPRWFSRKSRSAPAFLSKYSVIFVVLWLVLFAPLIRVTTKSIRIADKLRGEPMSTFFKWFPYSYTTATDQNRIHAALEDRLIRVTYHPTIQTAQRNIILIFADSLRADHMGVYGYSRETTPFLSQLQQQGRLHKVEMALSTCSETFCGIASTFTSRPFHQISSQNFKLHDLLAEQNYRVNFYLAGEHRHWNYLDTIYGANVDNLQDSRNNSSYVKGDDRLIINALKRIKPFAHEANFFYFFLMSTHVAGLKDEAFERYKPAHFENIVDYWNHGSIAPTGSNGSATLRSDELAIVTNRYDNGVLQADARIGEIFALLETKGYLQNSVVVITGDHGDGLGEHGDFGHSRFLYQEHVRVPLLIYDKEISVYKNNRFATQVDIAPTLLERSGLPIPKSWGGISLMQIPRERVTLHQTVRVDSFCRAIVHYSSTSLFKYIRCGVDKAALREELFDLLADPKEQRNLALSANESRLARFRSEFDERFSPIVKR